MSTGLTSNGKYRSEKLKEANVSKYREEEEGLMKRAQSMFMQIVGIKELTYPSLGSLRIAVKELRNVGHDRLLVRTLHVNVLRVQKPGDSQFSVRNLNKNTH